MEEDDCHANELR